MRTKGGSAQDRRRARRAAERQAIERMQTLSQGMAQERPLTLAQATDALIEPRTLAPGEMLAEADLPEGASAERIDLSARLTLEAVRATFADDPGMCSDCGHAFSDHLGDAGPCTFEDDAGACSCGGYAEPKDEASAQADEFEVDAGAHVIAFVPTRESLEEAVAVLTAKAPRSAELVRVRLEELTLAEFADGTVVLPDEHKPGEKLPKRNSSPDAPTPPAMASGREVAWTALFCPEGKLTDDGRVMAPGSIRWRELPLTLMAMLETTEGGHIGAQVSGRIDRIWRDEAAGVIRAEGVFDGGEYGSEIARLVGDETLTGVSVDLAIHDYVVGPKSDWFDADGNWAPKEPAADEGEPSLVDLLFGGDEQEQTIFVVTDAVIGATTVCPFPAFEDASIALVAALVASARPGTATFVTRDAEFQITREPTITASAAGLAPLKPPAEWFAPPAFEELTPLTVDEDGRIYGHAAVWDTCHIGIPDVCTTAPRSETNYAYFLLKEVECEGGERIACGTVTLEAPHADRRLGRADATAHYDNTGTAAADVTVGEDEFGIWFAGALRPDVDAEQARDLRGAVLSGDWRNVNGHLELVALLAVNVPGFPVPRARALVAAGDDGNEVLALVAAGINDGEDHDDGEFAARAEALRARAEFGGRFSDLAARAREAHDVETNAA